MRKILALIILSFGCVSCSPQKKPTEHVIDASKEVSYLFVLSSAAGTYENKTLTFEMVPLITYFSDRPHRVAGHFALKKFPQIWEKEEVQFKQVPPNATLSIFHKGAPVNIVLEVTDPVVDGKKISFTVEKVFDGTIPPFFEEATLFIDSVSGGPLVGF